MLNLLQEHISSNYTRYSSLLRWFFLRREPYYHKLQYSKTPKFDVAAAILGVAISAFVGYLTLSTFGSAGADLTDMGILLWYLLLVYRIYLHGLFLCKSGNGFFFNGLLCLLWIFYGPLLARYSTSGLAS